VLLLSLAARCRIAFGTCRHWQTYLGQLYFLSRPKAFRVRLTSAASRSNEFLPLHRDFHRNTAEVLPELIRTNSRRAATRWCTWCRRANSTRCRSTTKWSGNRTSFRLTILGQKVVSSAPSASRTRLFSLGQCVQWLTTAVRFWRPPTACMVLPQTTSQEVLQGPSRRPNASRHRGDQASQTSHAQLDIKPRDDARDELFDLPFGLVTVADVAHPPDRQAGRTRRTGDGVLCSRCRCLRHHDPPDLAGGDQCACCPQDQDRQSRP
jgi:hypothetical protein